MNCDPSFDDGGDDDALQIVRILKLSKTERERQRRRTGHRDDWL